MKKKLLCACGSAAAILCLSAEPGHAAQTDEAFILVAEERHAAPMTLPASAESEPETPTTAEIRTDAHGAVLKKSKAFPEPEPRRSPTKAPEPRRVKFGMKKMMTTTSEIRPENSPRRTSGFSTDLRSASPRAYQPTEDGIADSDRPVMIKNFAGLGYNMTDHIRATPTAYWQWLPTAGGAYSVQDPFIKHLGRFDRLLRRISISTLIFAITAPVSNFSKQPTSREATRAFRSRRTFRKERAGCSVCSARSGNTLTARKAYGNDFEVYVGPNVAYQLTHKVQLTMIYETNLVHVYGTNPGTMEGDGTDLQPGVSIDITQRPQRPPVSEHLSGASFGREHVGRGALRLLAGVLKKALGSLFLSAV